MFISEDIFSDKTLILLLGRVSIKIRDNHAKTSSVPALSPAVAFLPKTQISLCNHS